MVGWIGGDVTVGLMTTVLSVLCIISADSGAYLVGKRFGKNKLISISPNKTVEGAVGGALGAVGVALGFSKVITWPEPHVAAAMGFLVFLGSLFGDLIESSLKREANMKDAGDLIPGHGGGPRPVRQLPLHGRARLRLLVLLLLVPGRPA